MGVKSIVLRESIAWILVECEITILDTHLRPMPAG
jgi:hypothetical protein